MIVADPGVHHFTISRKLNRNSSSDGYDPEAAEKLETERKQTANKAKKVNELLV